MKKRPTSHTQSHTLSLLPWKVNVRCWLRSPCEYARKSAPRESLLIDRNITRLRTGIVSTNNIKIKKKKKMMMK